jgi:hypothetical protein
MYDIGSRPCLNDSNDDKNIKIAIGISDKLYTEAKHKEIKVCPPKTNPNSLKFVMDFHLFHILARIIWRASSSASVWHRPSSCGALPVHTTTLPKRRYTRFHSLFIVARRIAASLHTGRPDHRIPPQDNVSAANKRALIDQAFDTISKVRPRTRERARPAGLRQHRPAMPSASRLPCNYQTASSSLVP